MASTQRFLPDHVLQAVLSEARPRLIGLLGRFAIPPEEATNLVADAQLVLLYKHRDIACPEEWLVWTVKWRCLEFAKSRRERLCQALDTAVIELLQGAAPGEERAALEADLKRNLAALPRRSRELLTMRYALANSARAAEDPPESPVVAVRLARAVRALGRQLLGLQVGRAA